MITKLQLPPIDSSNLKCAHAHTIAERQAPLGVPLGRPSTLAYALQLQLYTYGDTII